MLLLLLVMTFINRYISFRITVVMLKDIWSHIFIFYPRVWLHELSIQLSIFVAESDSAGFLKHWHIFVAHHHVGYHAIHASGIYIWYAILSFMACRWRPFSVRDTTLRWLSFRSAVSDRLIEWLPQTSLICLYEKTNEPIHDNGNNGMSTSPVCNIACFIDYGITTSYAVQNITMMS